MDAVFLSSCIPENLTTLFRPLGPYQVAWYLRKHGYSAQVIDFIFKMTTDEILDLIDKFVTKDTKVLGIGFMIGIHNKNMGAMIIKFENVLLKAKKRYPWIKTIVGSGAALFWSRRHRNATLFDYVLAGHAENSTLALFNYLYRGAPMPPFELIDGNKIIRETFTMPDGNLFNIEDSAHVWHDSDCIQPNETLPLELGRGCIFKCKFCRYPYIGKHKNDFNRSMDCVKEELIDNYNRWGTTNYYMLDDTFNADKERLKKFTEMTRTLPFKINYATYLRADLIHANPETEELLQESGLLACYLGIETLNKDAANLIGKPWSAKHAKDYLPKLFHDKWNKEISVILGLIAGLPPETLDECKQTNKWIKENELSGMFWYSLNIDRNAHSQYRSDFDINAENYGFRWVVKEGRPIWETDYCDEIIAQEWQVELMAEAKAYSNIAAWYLLELGNYGYDLQETKQLKMVDAGMRKTVPPLRKTWYETYIAQLKSLPV